MPFRLLDPTTAAPAPVVTAGAPLISVGDTLAAIRSEMLLELSSRSDVDTARLNKWINWGYRSLCAMLTPTELKGAFSILTVASQPFYLLPVQVRSIKLISIRTASIRAGGVELIPMDEDEYIRQPDLPTSVSTSWPTKYFRYGRMLVLWPDPRAVYTLDINYMIRPDDMTADNHSPLLPVEFHEPLLFHAKAKAWRSLRNYQEANIASNDFLAALRPLIDTDGEEKQQQPRGLTVARRVSDLTRSRR